MFRGMGFLLIFAREGQNRPESVISHFCALEVTESAGKFLDFGAADF